jgi:hypothetical protein
MTFTNPMHDGYRLDWCHTWATDCGEQAAMAWCKNKGYATATNWAQEVEVGARGFVTKIIGSGQLCNAPFCASFTSITCSSSSVATPTGKVSNVPAVPTSSPVTDAGEQVVTFDKLELGPLPPDAFASKGMQFVKEKGVPGIYRAERNMVLPKGRNQVLLVAGDRVTLLTITFNAPIKRFSLTRIGTAGGASVPTWTLSAYDSESRVVASTKEEHGLPPNPRQVSIEGLGIVRVQLSSDNRFGDGTWATWNSLPVAELKITR